MSQKTMIEDNIERLKELGKAVIICHALPGSGKTTTTTRLLEALRDAAEKKSVPIKVAAVSADNYFINASGVYVFNPLKIGAAHSQCFKLFIDRLYENNDVVIVDNTNVKVNEFMQYYKIACIANARIIFAEWEPSEKMLDVVHERCVHGVPRVWLNQRLKSWQSTPKDLITDRVTVTKQSIYESIEWNVETLARAVLAL